MIDPAFASTEDTVKETRRTERVANLIRSEVGTYLLSPGDDRPCCLLLKGIGSVKSKS